MSRFSIYAYALVLFSDCWKGAAGRVCFSSLGPGLVLPLSFYCLPLLLALAFLFREVPSPSPGVFCLAARGSFRLGSVSRFLFAASITCILT